MAAAIFSFKRSIFTNADGNEICAVYTFLNIIIMSFSIVNSRVLYNGSVDECGWKRRVKSFFNFGQTIIIIMICTYYYHVTAITEKPSLAVSGIENTQDTSFMRPFGSHATLQ